MSAHTIKPLSARLRRRHKILALAAKFTGCMTLVLTVASVIYVLITEVDQIGPRTAPQHFEGNAEGTSGPGRQAEHPIPGRNPT
jgi:hypothetical protein